jgi:hypothetical protein
MKKSQKFRPDYQVVRDGELGRVYKPVRLLILPCGGMISLMHGYDDTWLVFSLDKNGLVARSGPYAMKSVSEVMWRELCHQLTEADKNAITRRLVTEDGKLTDLPNPRRLKLIDRLTRLEFADDELVDGITEKTRQFCATHTDAEIETEYTKELAAYDERRASCGEGAADE